MNGLTTFLQHVGASCADDSFVRLTMSSPLPAAAPVERVLARLVELRGERQLSLTLREARRDTTRNLPIDEAIEWLGAQLRTAFTGATLATTQADWQLRLQDGQVKLIRHKPSAPAAPPRVHDEAKPTQLGDPAQPWLQGLGITDAQGRPRPKLADKHTQIDRFSEILSHLARDCGWHEGGAAAAPLRLVDVGCGKGHLTFAAWHLATHGLGRRAQVVGVETRGELVDAANALARTVAGDALTFVRGDIDAVPLPGADALIALHACNTATDHAIRRGVEVGAQLIVVAPCCHQEVRPQLGKPEPLAGVLAHGLFAERMAEWATDGLRTLVLEHCGYRTKAIEFVSSEHTGKNLLLAAVREAVSPTAERRAQTAAGIAAFKAFFGIGHQALDALLSPAG